MEVIFHLCYSCRSHCCCCEPLFRAWEQDKGGTSRIKQTQHTGVTAKLIWITDDFRSMHSLSARAAYRRKGTAWMHPLSSITSRLKTFQLSFLPVRSKKKNITQRRDKEQHSPTVSRVAHLNAKPRQFWRKKKHPAKNTQFSDRQMTSCCHLISFLA